MKEETFAALRSRKYEQWKRLGPSVSECVGASERLSFYVKASATHRVPSE